MGKNKKKFIDKKNASTYHLMHRSQRDVGGDLLAAGDGEEGGMEVGNSGMILWPNPNNNPETDRKVLTGGKEEEDTMRAWRNKLSQAGLLDEYDEQYLKPITGQGTFLSANGKVSDANGSSDPRAKEVAIRSSEELLGVAEVNAGELEHQFEGIGMAMELMDDDIQQALMGDFEEGDFEEILDDFVFEAAKEPEIGDSEDAFDFDAHIAKLMDDARKQREDKPNLSMDQHDWATKDQDFFANSKPLRVVGEEEYDDDSLFGNGHHTMTTSVLEVTPGVVPSLNPDEEKALCEQFERTLLEEYDSDEMGDILEEEIRGDRPLEGDAQVEAALEEYLQDKEDGFFMKGGENYHQEGTTGNRGGGSGFSALVGTRMVPVRELDNDNTAAVVDATPDEPFRPVSEVLKDAKKQIQSPELEPPPEEIFIDGKSYYSMKERNPWDCESILSTYSNLDNNPITIGTTISRKKKKKQQQQQKIKLSSKTGLPVLGSNNPVEEEDEEYYDDDDDDDNEQTIISINRGVARKKKETPAEKRARKAQVKKERQMARIQKKVTKEVYKEEFMNRAVVANTDGDVGNAGQAVFRYS